MLFKLAFHERCSQFRDTSCAPSAAGQAVKNERKLPKRRVKLTEHYRCP